MSGPMSSRISKLRLSLASPPVRWKASGKPSKSNFRWILLEKPPRDRPSACPSCPLCAGRRDMGAHDRRIDHLNEVSGAAHPRQNGEHGLEYAPLAQPPKPLPDAVPSAKLRWQGSPGDVVNRKIMQRFQELAIIAPLLPAARARRPKRLNHDLPIGIRHPGPNDRLPQADLL